jgi:hypothetical protein
MGNSEKSMNLAKESFLIFRDALGGKHPTTATAIANLAESYRRRGQSRQALDLAKETLAIRLDAFGESHTATTSIRRWIVRCLVEMGQAFEGKRAVEEWLEAVPPKSPAFHELVAIRRELLDTKGRPLRPGFRQPPSRNSRGRRR